MNYKQSALNQITTDINRLKADKEKHSLDMFYLRFHKIMGAIDFAHAIGIISPFEATYFYGLLEEINYYS